MTMLLAIDIGSTTTRIAVSLERERIIRGVLRHESLPGKTPMHELPARKQAIVDFLANNEVNTEEVDLIVSRGGLLKPGPSGIYRVNEIMCSDLENGRFGSHASALGPLIAFEMARTIGIDAVIVDPPSTDEFSDLARMSGMPDIPRRSAFHALNQKAAARRACREMGMAYEDAHLIVAHMGGGITVGAHVLGSVVDATHGLAEGPFTPERAGSLPTLGLIEHVIESGLTVEEVRALLVGGSGMYSYLGTRDARAVENRIRNGDEQARAVYQAMAYQVAKEIGAMTAVLTRHPDAIILTGGLAESEMFTGWICEMVGFLGEIKIYPGEDEIEALIEAGFLVLDSPELIKEYPPS